MRKPISAAALRDALADGKAAEIVVLPTERQSGGMFASMLIATASSARHAAALADRAVRAMKAHGWKNPGVEASGEREWTLIDGGDVIVHIMRAEARERYRLEELWGFEKGGD